MRRFIIYAAVLVLLVGCTKTNRYQTRGTLLGIDKLYCACCGGIILKIDNDPRDYRIDSLGSMTWHEIETMGFPQRISFNLESQFNCGYLIHYKIKQFTTTF